MFFQTPKTWLTQKVRGKLTALFMSKGGATAAHSPRAALAVATTRDRRQETEARQASSLGGLQGVVSGIFMKNVV